MAATSFSSVRPPPKTCWRARAQESRGHACALCSSLLYNRIPLLSACHTSQNYSHVGNQSMHDLGKASITILMLYRVCIPKTCTSKHPQSTHKFCKHSPATRTPARRRPGRRRRARCRAGGPRSAARGSRRSPRRRPARGRDAFGRCLCRILSVSQAC